MRKAVYGLYTYLEFFLIAILYLPAFLIVAAIYGRRDPGRRIRGRWMRRFGRVTARLTPLWKFSWEGKKPANIDTRAYVAVSNHESTADPFLLSSLPWDMRWIAKDELFRTPIVGWLLRCGGDISLRRRDKGSIENMFAEARSTLSSGMSLMIFPEGTRSPDGTLLPFKDGAFQLAIEAGAPILPIAVNGTRACRPKGSLWFGEATAVARVLEPIETAGMTIADVPRLRELARERIIDALTQLRQLSAVETAAAAPQPSASPLTGSPKPGDSEGAHIARGEKQGERAHREERPAAQLS